MIILYGPSRAPYTEKVRRALHLKKLDYRLREPESPEDYRRWSPRTGLLPVLEIDGERIPDSTEILLELDRRHPNPPLLSRDGKLADQQRQLEEWADESFLFYWMRWLRLSGDASSLRLPEENGAAEEGERRGLARFGPLRRLLAWLRAGGTWERPEADLLRGIADRMDDLVNFLGGRPFFYADSPGMADLAVYGMLYTLRYDSIPGAAALLAMRPSLVEFMRRVEHETGG